jgi:phytoene synthase
MSDTANPGKLASAAPLSSAKEFDARLKRTDENRWLATRYAPEAGRELLVALYLLHQELQRALQTSEPMLGKIRIQWWRETIAQISSKASIRRHDLAEELARVTKDRADLVASLNNLVDRYDDILDDHLHAGGHKADSEHEARHLAAEASLAQLAGRALDASATSEQLDAISRCAEAYLALTAHLSDAKQRWDSARKAARKIPVSLWPAIVHLAAVHDPHRTADNPRTADKAPLMKRWRVLQAMFGRRL